MICNKFGLNLNEDVAGATFMAAGSSAPELATSFVGTFLSESNVGVGTIIGSAVFNILVIVGATAILSTRPLQLNWRPVVRDNFFYLVSVILLIIVIKVGGDDDIETIDGVILLIWYTCYIIYMYFNEMVIEKFCPEEEDEEEEEEVETNDVESGKQIENLTMGATVQPDVEGKTDVRSETPSDVQIDAADEEGSQSKSPVGAGGQEQEDGVDMSAAPAATDGKKKSVPKPRRSLPSHHYLSHQHEDELATDYDSEEEDGADGEDGEDDQPWYDKLLDILSWPWEMLFNYTMPDCFYNQELVDNIKEKIDDKYYYLGGEFDEDYPEGVEPEDEHPDHPGLSYWDVRKKNFNQMSNSDPKKVAMLERQAKRKKARRQQLSKLEKHEFKDLTCGQRWFWATFFLSLLHITWMSYFMVEFMTKIGCLWHISDTVMGLTFLAMGTSIPDALGSLAVAEKGEGDMAVSNAVGSNVFDICMGLGLPWFIKCAAGSGPVPIDDTDTIIPSIIILVAIIVLLFTTFAVSGWRLINQVGYILLTAYGLFVIYSLVYEAVK